MLTTGEVQQLLEERNIGISEFEESSFDSLESDNRKQLDLIGCDGVSGETLLFPQKFFLDLEMRDLSEAYWHSCSLDIVVVILNQLRKYDAARI